MVGEFAKAIYIECFGPFEASDTVFVVRAYVEYEYVFFLDHFFKLFGGEGCAGAFIWFDMGHACIDDFSFESYVQFFRGISGVGGYFEVDGREAWVCV